MPEQLRLRESQLGKGDKNNGPLRPQPCRIRVNSNIMQKDTHGFIFPDIWNQNGRDYMTESPGNEPGSALFARIQQMVSERGVDIRQSLNGNALHLEFADGQRILVNFDAQTNNVWLAARSGGIEFIHRNGIWRAHDQSELFARLREIMEQTIASNPLNARAPSPTDAPACPPRARRLSAKPGRVTACAMC